MEQYLDSSVGKRSAEQMHDPLVVLQECVVVVEDGLALIGVEEPLVPLKVFGPEGVANEVLLPDDNQLSGGQRIPLHQEVGNGLLKLGSAELNLAAVVDDKRIERILLQPGRLVRLTVSASAETKGNQTGEDGRPGDDGHKDRRFHQRTFTDPTFTFLA